MPDGSAVVVNVAVPVGSVTGLFKTAVPKTVVTLLFVVEKLMVPAAVVGVTVAVKVTLVPWLTVVGPEAEMVTELAARDPAHTLKSASMSSEPRPVTEL